ncbi:PREDICTED: uncharacterized protein LOC109474355 [Branchiostoma belcheri]|uniref:Uncharacterized protein LOC109474355 n=1 Tax=Branchiostoma belcheri TaxID=7741 RepID=A0A6P4ZGL0_BRABE|nr:PREDICTED: uncharacterized protein LOC109474355 [Branchiostoma belcheri]
MDAPHGDPRAWTREQVKEWIISQGCRSMDLNIEGDELCRKGRRWFRDNFPGMGQKLRDDLQRRRDAIANERMFADKGRTEKRVTEGTRVAFLTMAFQICMIFYLLREQLQKASNILQHLYALLDVVKRRAGKNKVDPDLFREGRIQSSITSRAAVGSDEVTLVHGSECIDVTGETNSKAVTTMCEAMNVIGADLKIKFKIALWKKVAFGAAAASAVGLTAGGAAVFFGAFTNL